MSNLDFGIRIARFFAHASVLILAVELLALGLGGTILAFIHGSIFLAILLGFSTLMVAVVLFEFWPLSRFLDDIAPSTIGNSSWVPQPPQGAIREQVLADLKRGLLIEDKRS